jgi:hypothetical protein
LPLLMLKERCARFYRLKNKGAGCEGRAMAGKLAFRFV